MRPPTAPPQADTGELKLMREAYEIRDPTPPHPRGIPRVRWGEEMPLNWTHFEGTKGTLEQVTNRTPDATEYTLQATKWPGTDLYTLQVINYDDKFKPVSLSGLWATSQGVETSKAYNRTQTFIEAFWQSTSLTSSGTC